MTDQSAEAVLWLTENKDMSVNQIARQMNMTPGAVRNALVRAQKAREPRTQRIAGAGYEQRRLDPPNRLIQRVDRDPCGRCNTRQDVHDELGCKRWRPSR